jgi:hypothetical protein
VCQGNGGIAKFFLARWGFGDVFIGIGHGRIFQYLGVGVN